MVSLKVLWSRVEHWYRACASVLITAAQQINGKLEQFDDRRIQPLEKAQSGLKQATEDGFAAVQAALLPRLKRLEDDVADLESAEIKRGLKKANDAAAAAMKKRPHTPGVISEGDGCPGEQSPDRVEKIRMALRFETIPNIDAALKGTGYKIVKDDPVKTEGGGWQEADALRGMTQGLFGYAVQADEVVAKLHQRGYKIVKDEPVKDDIREVLSELSLHGDSGYGRAILHVRPDTAKQITDHLHARGYKIVKDEFIDYTPSGRDDNRDALIGVTVLGGHLKAYGEVAGEAAVTIACSNHAAIITGALGQKGDKIVKDEPAKRPIETAPRDGRKIVVWNDENGNGPQIVRMHSSGKWVLTWNRDIFFDPTHWAPCPGEE
jgi:hypothetical protein